MQSRLEQVQAERARLAAEFEPRISKARQEAEDASAAFEEARERRDAATDAHKKLTDRYEYERVLVGNPGGGRA